MKTKAKYLAAVVALMSPMQVQASEQGGDVTTLTIYSGSGTSQAGLVQVRITGGTRIGTVPACATSPFFVVRNEGSTGGQGQIAQLLAAQVSGRQVYIFGTGTCTRWGDSEDILYLNISQ